MHDQQNIKTTVFVFKSGTYKNQFALKMVGGTRVFCLRVLTEGSPKLFCVIMKYIASLHVNLRYLQKYFVMYSPRWEKRNEYFCIVRVHDCVVLNR